MKNAKVLEKKRPLFFASGLLVATAIVLVSFEWRTPYVVPKIPVGTGTLEQWETDLVDILPETKLKVDKPELPQITKPTDQIEVVADNATVETTEENNLMLTEDDIAKLDGEGFRKSEETEVEDPNIGPVDWAPVMPTFCGGEDALKKTLADNLKYPEIPRSMGVTGTVYVQFVVGTDGQVHDAKVIRAVDPWLDAEALRVVKLLDCFHPGKQGGKPVEVLFRLPIRFTLAR